METETLTWTDIRQWIAEEDAIIASGRDSITVFDGEEGNGKSYAMLAKNILSDSTFYSPGAWSPGYKPEESTDRVVFDELDFMQQAIIVSQAGPGRAIQLDELDGNKRASNTRKRLRLLKFLKERRSLKLRATIGFPHINQLDDAILLSRVRYRAQTPRQGLIKVTERRKVREYVDDRGRIIPVMGWVHRGTFPIPNISGFRIVLDYESKKLDFTNRPVDLLAEEVEPSRHVLNVRAARPVIEKIRVHLKL
jgi:hypothetical protein